ncbi:MAG: DUF7453 family protein [Blastocatellia bacterium]
MKKLKIRSHFVPWALLFLTVLFAGALLAATQDPTKPTQQKPQEEEEPVAITERSAPAPTIQPQEVTPDQFANFRSPLVNAAGEIAVFGLHLQPDEPNRSGQRLYLRTLDGNWQPLLRQGEETIDTHLKLVELTKPALSNRKEATFVAQFKSTNEKEQVLEPTLDPNDPAYYRPPAPSLGIFRKTAEGIRTVLVLGGEVPNMPSTLAGVSNLSANDKGTTAFIGTYVEPDGRGLFYHDNEKLRIIVRSGQKIGPNETSTFSEHYYPSDINEQDEVAFLGRTGEKSGIFLAGPQGVQIIALSGRLSPIKGAKFIGFGNRTPGINNKGEIVFVGFFDGPQAGRALFVKPPGGPVRMVLRSGQTVAGTTYNFTDFNSVGINDQGEILFIATYGGRTRGIFLKTAKGVETIALANQPIPGGTREEAYNNFTQPAFNSRGDIVFYSQWRTPKTGIDVGVFWRDLKGEVKLLFKRGDLMPK